MGDSGEGKGGEREGGREGSKKGERVRDNRWQCGGNCRGLQENK